MNIYDVAELQQYLYPQVNQQSTQLVDPSMLLPQLNYKRFLNVPRGITTISPGTGVPGVLEPGGDFRMIPGYIDRNTNIYRGDAASSKGIMDLKPLGFDTSLGVANEEDVEQVDYLGSKPNKIQTGIAKLLEFLQKFSPIAAVGRGIESIRNRFDTRKAIRDDIIRDRQGTIDNIISPRIMNIQPTAQDIARGGGSIPTRTTSRRTSPQGGMQAERTRSRDLGRMRGGVGR